MSNTWVILISLMFVLLLGIVVAQVSIFRHIGYLYQKLDTVQPDDTTTHAPVQHILAPGALIPNIPLRSLSGTNISISEFAGKPTLFAVVNPGCQPCDHLIAQLIAEAQSTSLPLKPFQQRVIMSTGDLKRTQEVAQGVPTNIQVLIVPGELLQQIWGVMKVPVLISVDEQLRVISEKAPALAV
jgi:hypothetical protein